MAIHGKLLMSLVFGWGTLLGQVNACSCAGGELCDYVQQADVVLHATAVSRSDQAGINDDVTYTVSTLTMYKSEPDVSYEQEISFITGGNSALCGIYLEVGEDYLIHLAHSDYFDGYLAGNACGGTKSWGLVTVEETEILQHDACSDDGVCEPSCGEFQECLRYEEGTENEQYYCADVCDPSPCLVSEGCVLFPVMCVQYPCPAVAHCINFVQDPCNGSCSKFQECLVFAEGTEYEEYYCADVCDPSPCAADEECSLEPLICAHIHAPCPNVAVCSPSTDDPCRVDPIDGTQESLVYMEGTKCREDYSVNVCDPSPCGVNDICETISPTRIALVDIVCPPVAQCPSHSVEDPSDEVDIE